MTDNGNKGKKGKKGTKANESTAVKVESMVGSITPAIAYALSLHPSAMTVSLGEMIIDTDCFQDAIKDAPALGRDVRVRQGLAFITKLAQATMQFAEAKEQPGIDPGENAKQYGATIRTLLAEHGGSTEVFMDMVALGQEVDSAMIHAAVDILCPSHKSTTLRAAIAIAQERQQAITADEDDLPETDDEIAAIKRAIAAADDPPEHVS